MSLSTTGARWRASIAAAAVPALAALAFAAPASASDAKVGPPSSMTALGDSITRGFHTGSLLQDVPANSWATGTNTTVNSVCLRIKALNSAMACGAGANGGNDAVTGAKVAGTVAQAEAAVKRSPKPELVEILIGANDVCTSTESAMTSTQSFESSFRQTMNILRTGLPDARIQVLSIPNIYNLWNVGKGNFSATFTWGLLSICQSMLASPTSTTQANVDRRNRVKARNEAFNDILKAVCDEYVHCKFDNYAAYNLQFVLGDLSTIDYFHPNVQGQAKAARVAWESGFDYSDASAPATTIVRDRAADGVEDWYRDDVTVSLEATDEQGVAGSEFFYKLVGADDQPWERYTGPFTISAEGRTEVVARSVDVNGNVEASKHDVIKIDKTAPTFALSCTSPALLGGSAAATVSDVSDGDGSGFAVDYAGSSALDTSRVGRLTSTTEIQDKAGNTARRTCAYDVQYAFSGVLQPINAGGSSIFKLGSTVPVKFRATDAGGNAVSSVIADLGLAKISDGVAGTDAEAVSTAAATTGTRFRCGDEQCIYNLSTKGLSTGTWRLTIALDDGTTHTAQISLR